MKAKIFTNVVANVVIVALILSLVVLTGVGSSVSVFDFGDDDPVYKGNSADAVCLMINVYWGTEYIDGILETLHKYNATTTFFVGGCWAVKNPDVLKKIVEHGHEIGNHGYFHKQHSKLTAEQNETEIASCGKVVYQLTGTTCTLFAPPSGDFGKKTLAAAKKLGYRTIMWSRDTIDWRDKDSELVFTRATKDVSGGDFILMHPTAHTLSALDKILRYYKKVGLRVAPVGQLLSGV